MLRFLLPGPSGKKPKPPKIKPPPLGHLRCEHCDKVCKPGPMKMHYSAADDGTSADDRDFDTQLPQGWEPVEEMPAKLKSGINIMFRWKRSGWATGIVKGPESRQGAGFNTCCELSH